MKFFIVVFVVYDLMKCKNFISFCNKVVSDKFLLWCLYVLVCVKLFFCMMYVFYG